MKLIIFSLVFLVLLAAGISARGIAITDMRMNVEYNDAYTYQLEFKTRANYVSGLSNNSIINADVFPGDNITFTVRMENTLSGSGPENRLRNAVAKITIVNIDSGSNLEGESDGFNLEGGDDAIDDIKFPVPFDVSTGTYNVIIDAEADGKNGTFYFTENKLKLQVKKLTHDIRITKAQLNPSILDCSRKTKITADMVNAGSNSEDDMALEFISPELKINSIDRAITLESSDDATIEDKKYTKNLNAELPASFKSGTYPVFVNLYWKNAFLFDKKTLYMTVRDCSSSVNTSPKPKPKQNATNSYNNSDIRAQMNESGQSGDYGPGSSAEAAKFSISPALVLILFGGFLIFIIAILLIMRKFK